MISIGGRPKKRVPSHIGYQKFYNDLKKLQEGKADKPTPKFMKEKFPKQSKLPSQDVIINRMLPSDIFFQDHDLCFPQSSSSYKIHRFLIGTDGNRRVSTLRFDYVDLQSGEEIEGKWMISPETYEFSEGIFFLDRDEFLTGVEVNQGFYVDHLGFFTTKGRMIGYEGRSIKLKRYRLQEGYHIGSISSAFNPYLIGFQFDVKKIPRIKVENPDSFFKKISFERKNEQNSNKKSFVFFDNEKLFSYATEYLSCKQTMNLFLVSRKIAQFRKISEAFWLKCWKCCHPFMLTYLQGIADLYKVAELRQFLAQNTWAKVPLQFTNWMKDIWEETNIAGVVEDQRHIQDQNINGPLMRLKFGQKFLQNPQLIGNHYLIIVNVTYLPVLNEVYPLFMLDDQKNRILDTSSIKYPFNKNLQIRKISVNEIVIQIFVKITPQTIQILSKICIKIGKHNLQFNTMCTPTWQGILSKQFKPYKQDIFMTCGNKIWKE